MTLILTEKPNIAADFAKALGAVKKQKAFVTDEYVIVAARGHLFEASKPAGYDARYRKWTVRDLPILPETFKYVPINDPDIQSRIAFIRQCLKDTRINRIILATDPDREGEVIGRLILSQTMKRDIPILRFWATDSLTTETVKTHIKTAQPLREFDHLYHQGDARAKADWYVGMNFSRFYSLALGGTHPVGRVQTAVLKAIFDRDVAISRFVPETRFRLLVNFLADKGQFHAVYHSPAGNDWVASKHDGEDILHAIRGEVGIVTSVEKKTIRAKPPKLMNLNALQRLASSRFKWSAAKTLEVAQELYDHDKVISYPRAESRVMNTGEVEKVRAIAQDFLSAYPDYRSAVQWQRMSEENSRIFNSAEVKGHSAIIPLRLPETPLSGEKKQLFDLLVNAFFQALGGEYITNRVKAVILCGDYQFMANGVTVIEKGYRAIAELQAGYSEPEYEALVELEEGENCRIVTELLKDFQTRPPAHYTDESILAFMEHPIAVIEAQKRGIDEIEDDLAEEIAVSRIGTMATQHTYVEKLIGEGYITRDGKQRLTIQKKGIRLIVHMSNADSVAPMLDAVTTSEWEKYLTDDPTAFEKHIRSFVSTAISALKSVPSYHPAVTPEVIGPCPLCHSDVEQSGRGYSCVQHPMSCEFHLPSDIGKTPLEVGEVQLLLSGERTPMRKMTSKKSGKPSSAMLSLDGDGKLQFHFPQKRKGKKVH
jgi:DNA topoisomerase-3